MQTCPPNKSQWTPLGQFSSSSLKLTQSHLKIKSIASFRSNPPILCALLRDGGRASPCGSPLTLSINGSHRLADWASIPCSDWLLIEQSEVPAGIDVSRVPAVQYWIEVFRHPTIATYWQAQMIGLAWGFLGCSVSVKDQVICESYISIICCIQISLDLRS